MILKNKPRLDVLDIVQVISVNDLVEYSIIQYGLICYSLKTSLNIKQKQRSWGNEVKSNSLIDKRQDSSNKKQVLGLRSYSNS